MKKILTLLFAAMLVTPAFSLENDSIPQKQRKEKPVKPKKRLEGGLRTLPYTQKDSVKVKTLPDEKKSREEFRSI